MKKKYHCRFVKVLDHIDSRVETLRREALTLQSQTELLNMSIDLLKNHENLHFLEDCKCFILFRDKKDQK